LLLLLFLLLLCPLFYVHVYEDTKCFQTSLSTTGIRVLPRSFRIPSPFSITHTNYSSAKFVSATNLVCKNVDIFRKRTTF